MDLPLEPRGEAYMPMAAVNRARSIEIWREVLRRIIAEAEADHDR